MVKLRSGHGSNSYRLECNKRGSKNSYFICQQVISLALAEKIPPDSHYSECAKHIGDGSCPALLMQREEQTAGKELYYTPYPMFAEKEEMAAPVTPAKVDVESESYKRGRFTPDDNEVLTRAEPIKRRKTMDKIPNSDQVFELIESIAAISGKNAKDAAVGEALDNPGFLAVVKAALDPFITYGLKKIDEAISTGDGEFNDGTISILERLASRELSGNEAKREVSEELARLSPSSGSLLVRIIKKDLRASFTADTVNRAQPGTIFVFKCQLAHPYVHKKTKQPRKLKFPVVVEDKLDGNRGLMIYDAGECGFFSRTGKRFEACDNLAAKVVRAMDGSPAQFVIDGEITNGTFLETGSVRRKSEQADTAVFTVFDYIPYDTFPNCDHPMTKRRAVAKRMVERLGIENIIMGTAKLANDHDQVMAYYQKVRDQGGEGIIIKATEGKYVGGRSYDWLKVKGEETADVVITGFKAGEAGKKYEHTLGAITVDYNGKSVDVPAFPEPMRDEIWNNQEQYLGRLIEVEYHEETEYGSLRHPRFIRFRDDKPVEDGVGC